MTTFKILSAGCIAAAMLIAPAMAQEATQEPGAMGFNYPDSRYLTGGMGTNSRPDRVSIIGISLTAQAR